MAARAPRASSRPSSRPVKRALCCSVRAAIARSEIELLTGPLRSPDTASGVVAPRHVEAPLRPRARLRLGASHVESGEAFLAFGAPPEGVSPSLNLSIRGDLSEAATNLFAMLRALDESHSMIAVAPIPSHGLGEAINDRLKRAGAHASENEL